MSQAETTTDHDAIRRWIEERGGRPARVAGTGEGEDGLLRVDFREPDDALEEIPWEEFFAIFDRNRLAFLHQDETAGGKTSRFHKFVER
jgi:hypothetical protein